MHKTGTRAEGTESTQTATPLNAASVANSNLSDLDKETQVTSFTGDDKSVGPNAPVGEVQSKTSSSNVPSESSLAGDEKIRVSGEGIGHDMAIEKNEEEVNETGALAEGEEAEDESKYPRGIALALLTFGLCLALFVVALDNTIIGKESYEFGVIHLLTYQQPLPSLESLPSSTRSMMSAGTDHPTSSPPPPCSHPSARSTHTSTLNGPSSRRSVYSSLDPSYVRRQETQSC